MEKREEEKLKCKKQGKVENKHIFTLQREGMVFDPPAHNKETEKNKMISAQHSSNIGKN